MTEQQIPQPSDRIFSAHGMFSALAVAGASALLLMGCEGATGPAGPTGATGTAGTGVASNFEYLVQVTTIGGSGAVVAVDPISFQLKRGGTPDVGLDSTSSLNNTLLRDVTRPTDRAAALLRTAVEMLGLSARGHDRVLRVARTLADLEGVEPVDGRHVAEALQYRGAPVTPVTPD